MDLWTLLQIAITSVLAAATALLVNARKERERVSCFVDWKYVEGDEGIEEFPYLGVHNRSSQPIAVHRVRFWVGGLLVHLRVQGTALAFDDPLDLSFPYLVSPGEIKVLVLDEAAARRLAGRVPKWKATLFRIIRTPRIFVEVRTTAQTRILVGAEGALPWGEQLSPGRN